MKRKHLTLLSWSLAAICLEASLKAGASPKDSFDASALVIRTNQPAPSPPTEKIPERAKIIRLKIGEVVPVLVHEKSLTQPRRAFYLAAEANALVQVYAENKLGKVTYFLKGLAEGKTVGGVVQRAWLDDAGRAPKNPAMEARVQAAVKAEPYLITVEAAEPSARAKPNQP